MLLGLKSSTMGFLREESLKVLLVRTYIRPEKLGEASQSSMILLEEVKESQTNCLLLLPNFLQQLVFHSFCVSS